MRMKLIILIVLIPIIILATSCGYNLSIEKEEAGEEKPTEIIILSYRGVTANGDIIYPTGEVVEEDIETVEIIFEATGFDIYKDIIEITWQLEGEELLKGDRVEVLEGYDDRYLVRLKYRSGYLPQGEYTCTIKINNTLADSIDFEIKRSELSEEERNYLVEVMGMVLILTDGMGIYGNELLDETYSENYSIARCKEISGQAVEVIDYCYMLYMDIDPPYMFKEAHILLDQSMDNYYKSNIYLKKYINESDIDLGIEYIDQSAEYLELGSKYLESYNQEINKIIGGN